MRVLRAARFAAISAQAQTLPTAPQVASQINLGWNLGNTLEAICSETAWGNPATNQALINSVKAAGFNAIRIPVSWNCHITDGSTNIPADWTARVKQVVDMAIGREHVRHHQHPLGRWLAAGSRHRSGPHPGECQAERALDADRHHLPQLRPAPAVRRHERSARRISITPTAAQISVQQSYNQTFVTAVRATGGNNASRSLVVQTYNTNVQHGLAKFTLPPTRP